MSHKHPYLDQSMWKGAPPSGFEKAELLRKKMTAAEKMLWQKLRNNQFHGYKFRRQHPIHRFIVDFYCHKLKLIIEVDGGYHERDQQKLLDCERSKLLEFQGLKIIRFTNEEVLSNIECVLKKIEEEIEAVS